jgi:hypothetical protein
MLGPSLLSEASARAKIKIDGRMMRRGGKRSSRTPMPGETKATVIAASANVPPMASRFQPNAVCSGFRKRLKV